MGGLQPGARRAIKFAELVWARERLRLGLGKYIEIRGLVWLEPAVEQPLRIGQLVGAKLFAFEQRLKVGFLVCLESFLD